jgi:sulfatase maturation enzyme AslB (radical SAM superfamily)
VNYGYIKLENEKLLSIIQEHNPSSISWSNIPDYMNKHDFFKIAKKCSMKEAIHLIHSMNWIQSVYGTNIIDYESKNRRDLLDKFRKELSKFNLEHFPNLLKSLPYSHPYSITDYGLSLEWYKKWIESYFKGAQTKVLTQRISSFLPFYQSQTILCIVFTFDLSMENDERSKMKMCMYCRKDTNELKTCGRCHFVTYCSRECQTAHWIEHKKTCNQK